MYYISTVTFVLITLFFIWRGYKKGLGGSLIRIGSCFLGYVMAILLTNPVSVLLSKIDFIDGLIIYVISGTLVLVLVIMVCDISGNRAFDKMIYKKPIPESTYQALKFGGGFVGILVGCFFGFITAYLINFKISQLPENMAKTQALAAQQAQEYRIQQHYAKAQSEFEDEEPEKEYHHSSNEQPYEVASHDSFIDRMSKKFVSAAITTVAKVTADDEASVRIAKIISSDPQLSISHFRNIANDPYIMSVFSDRSVQAKLKTGSVKLLLQDAKFRALITNPNMRFLKPVSHEYSSTKPDVVATKIVIKSWNRLQKIKNNPRVIEILSDKTFQQSLQHDNTLSLMMNKDLKELTDIILGKE